MRIFVDPDDIYLHLEQVDFRTSVMSYWRLSKVNCIKRIHWRTSYLPQQ
ncbi:hypothetical protein [uncultured Paraglaciecola sp.]|nr:hypothetical protein [uncultured Paraglaciecola sp.]